MAAGADVGAADASALLERRAQIHAELLRALSESTRAALIAEAAETIASRLADGGTVFFCGNGGSAADAEHLAAEFVGRYQAEREPLAAIALGSTHAVSSALANDYGYGEAGLARELEALARDGDVLVALSTSGRSPNILSALEVASGKGLATIVLTGEGHAMAGAADTLIVVGSSSVALIQEAHAVVGHVLCELVEARLGLAQ